MEITIDDRRREERVRKTRRDIDGTPLTAEQFKDRRIWDNPINSTESTNVHDTRTVIIRFEENDYTIGAVPRSLDRSQDRKASGTFVERMEIQFHRSADDDGYNRGGRWRRTLISVRGANRKKNGTPGLKGQELRFPTLTWTELGIWTEADINPLLDPESITGKKERERIGIPKFDHVADPLPGWVRGIVDRAHPDTGALPFQYTTLHLFGDFADQSWNPDVAIELVGK